MLAGRSVALCIGLHAGLNLAAVVCGIPPTRFALPATLALLGGAGILAVGIARGAANEHPGSRRTDGH